MKPILFNTAMVQAILEGRKTTTRRIIKDIEPFGKVLATPKGIFSKEGLARHGQYHIGDILYVRETWCDRWLPDGFLEGEERYGYKADGEPSYGLWGNDSQCKLEVWIPSIHMPKEAARIFLKVISVEVERLNEMTEDEAVKEGAEAGYLNISGGPFGNDDDPQEWTALEDFKDIWDSTINKKDLNEYGWNANPWVWVIEFERIDKSEVEQ
ncbi:hypothetical protein [Veillonella sp.]|uniref:hypothetical protein n=1 Tax=Veillonella sp. TaxID=1926307 RepID=UPI00257A51CE|nr:hypothetical protein [Veillonella sp.]MBS6486401.1 hypothetical protein [Veillonella sp.]